MSWRRLSSAGLALLLLPCCSPRGTEPGPAVSPLAAKIKSPVAARSGKGASAPVLAPATPRRPPPAQGSEASTSLPQTPDALADRAEKEMARGNTEEAIRLLEQTLAAQPDHRKGLFLLACANYTRAADAETPLRVSQYIQAARLIRKLRDTYKDLSDQERNAMTAFLYNEACAYAVDGKPEKAVETLAESIDAGFDGPELVAADPDLVSIRKLPRFTELMNKLEQKAREQAASTAKLILAENAPFAFDFELPNIEGNKVRLGDLKGDVLLVDFWGTWCPPCRKELTHLKQLLAKYRDQGLVIVGINYERGAESDAKETVRQFLAEHRVPFTCLIGDDATRNQVPDWVGYPTLLFLDRSRKVRAKVVGYRAVFELEAIVERLLGEAPKTN